MHKSLTAVLVIILLAGISLADDKPMRSDLTAEDLVRVQAITAPTTDFSKPERFEALPAGAATNKKLVNRDAFSLFSANLSFEDQERFNLGNGFFTKVWVPAPSSTQASDGLGPLFNARGCQNCDLKDGRGHPPMGAADDGVSMFLRVSVPAKTRRRKGADGERRAERHSRANLRHAAAGLRHHWTEGRGADDGRLQRPARHPGRRHPGDPQGTRTTASATSATGRWRRTHC